MAKDTDWKELWAKLFDHLWDIIVKQSGATVVITAEEPADGGPLQTQFYTLSSLPDDRLKELLDLHGIQELAIEAEKDLRGTLPGSGQDHKPKKYS